MSLLSYTIVANTAIFSPSLPSLSSPPSWTTHHTRHTHHRTLIVAQARKGISSSRTRRLEKQGKKKEEEEEEKAAAEAEAWAARQAALYPEGTGGGSEVYSTGPMPNTEWEEKTDFWEGPQWEWFGFFLQFQWAFGVAFALVACGIAVTTYNEGATDFKQTPVYKESLQSQELLEEPDASNSNVFEGNPTEEAPSLE